MDFISKKYLLSKRPSKKNTKELSGSNQLFFSIYQQLGAAWEFFGLHCKHWDGYRARRNGQQTCRICGKIKGVNDNDHDYLLPANEVKVIGRRLVPNSKEIFKNQKEARILYDTINFHGVFLNVDVHNGYKANLFGKDHTVNMAAERIVTLKESGIQCSIDPWEIDIRLKNSRRKAHKTEYGGFPWEIRKQNLKKFPVIFRFDKDHNLLGITILEH